MKTLKELYREKNGGTDADFERRVFWRSLYWRAVPFVLFLGGPGGAFFSADRRLVAEVGRATTLAQVQRHLSFFASEWDNRRWIRRRLKIRVSGRRIKRLADQFLSNPAPAARIAVPYEGSEPGPVTNSETDATKGSS